MDVRTAPDSFSHALQLLTASQFLISDNWRKNAEVDDGEHFDFIIVGGGTAGSIVANRLSENPEWDVLLIEAGPDPPLVSVIPALAVLMFSSKHDWKYLTVPNEGISEGFINGSMYNYRGGKMLGGGHSINGMFYFKGIDQIYQKWYDLGNKEWHPSVTRQYSKKAEVLRSEKLLQNSEARNNYGSNGPIPINQFNNSEVEDLLLMNVMSAYDEIGIKPVLDLNSKSQLGVGISTMTAEGGKRASTATTYLYPSQHRTNLKILKNTLVTKVLIDGYKRAYGVEILTEYDGKQRLYADVEVILSAGALRTPQILMLSGIGPKDVLESYDINCIVDSKGVGKNFHDHVAMLWPIFADKPRKTTVLDVVVDVIKYLFHHSGLLAKDITDDLISFFPVNKSSNYPEIESTMLIMGKNCNLAHLIFDGFNETIVKSVAENAKDHASYIFSMQNINTFSEGYVTIRSSNPEDPPVINPNILGDKRDLENLAAGCLKLTELVNTKYFKSINGYVGRLDFEPCNDFDVYTIDYWRCIVKSTANTAWHATGTAKMGNDSKAVVSSRLTVHGVRGLRVIDASVMPTQPSCNTNGPTIMVAERASDLVKEDYGFI